MRNLSLDDLLNREIDPAFRRRAKIIIKNLNLKKGDNVLEIGCGRGFYANIIGNFFQQCEYVGIDINKDYLNVAKNFAKSKNVNFQYGDTINLPFNNRKFDKVICSEVLEHLQDDEKALAEIFRILKPEGIVLITVPHKNYPFLWDPLNWILERVFGWHISSNIWWLAGIWADHVRLYTNDELIHKVKSANLQIDKIWRSTKYCFPFSHFILYGIGKNLVEKGFCRSVSRFNVTNDISPIAKVAQKLIYLFDKRNDSYKLSKKDIYVNIIVKALK